jgi:hypothetical protein
MLSLSEVQPDGFNWVNVTVSEMTKYKTIAQATLAKIQQQGGKLYRMVNDEKN